MNKVQLSRLRAKFHTLPLVYSICSLENEMHQFLHCDLYDDLRKINEGNKFSANYNNHDRVI